jgi:hypothetical protein
MAELLHCELTEKIIGVYMMFIMGSAAPIRNSSTKAP